MSRIPDYTHNVSLKMSQVMDEIGVNEKIVMKRRKLSLLSEAMYTLTRQVLDSDNTIYFFGSHMEGTTTPGLRSDTDYLCTFNSVNVIQDRSELEYGKQNLLMIQDEAVSPGYCFLQVLRDDVPLPAVVETKGHLSRDGWGGILLKNPSFNSVAAEYGRHGPAQTKKGGPGFYDADIVAAFTCRSFPVQAMGLLDQHKKEYWLSNDIIQYCFNTGCFVVGIGNKGSENEILEWRISTSLAERCLMFNINITQIRCYVLIKMILKTFITPKYAESVSSFMCKTVLLHCISNTNAVEWKDSTFLTCLSFCLSTLYNCVSNEYCPHFIIPENNLMIRRFSQETKPFILKALHCVNVSHGKALLEIECDNFGLLLQRRLNGRIARNAHFVLTVITEQQVVDTALSISICFNNILCRLRESTSRQAIGKVSAFMTRFLNAQHDHMDRKYCSLIAQYLCQTMGSILASLNIYRRDNLTYKALSFMSLGLNSDVASGKLKQASVFYRIGDSEKTELILKHIEKSYDLNVVEPICGCHNFMSEERREKFISLCYESNQEYTLIKHKTASCVRFLRCEVNCCPHELQYEMFRSTQGDLVYRTLEDEWMDMSVVDSLPYFYFLQYKIYSRLGKEEERNIALLNLDRIIKKEPNLGHRETALNLLGQCMEKDNFKDYAFKCYILSLELRKRNNAAIFLICSLLSNMIHGL